jgi:hypothetical protein
MLETLSYAIIEDNVGDQEEVAKQIVSAGFIADKLIDVAETYDDAKALLEGHAEQLDVVFLDLRLPRDAQDGRPERAHGKKLLDLIHGELNRRAEVDIRVIVVSGEDIQDGMTDATLRQHYSPTLVDIAPKADLPSRIKSSVKKLTKDPLLMRLRRARVDVAAEYEDLMNTGLSVDDRLKAAKRLACRLVRYDGDFRKGRVGAWDGIGEDLNGAIKAIVESRFRAPRPGYGIVKIDNLGPGEYWEQFLWRGAMLQHLYTINAYRGVFQHLEEQAYTLGSDKPDEWKVPAEVLAQVEQGDRVIQAVELLVRELLDWYLPWHEQIYQPWAAAQRAAAGGGS